MYMSKNNLLKTNTLILSFMVSASASATFTPTPTSAFASAFASAASTSTPTSAFASATYVFVASVSCYISAFPSTSVLAYAFFFS